MSSRHPDNDIDKIFKNAIEPVDTEPSDKFWNKAYDDIIKREGQVNNSQVHRWKVIAYTLAAAFVILVFFTFYMNGKINTIQKQVTEVEKNQPAPIVHENESNNGSIRTAINYSTATAQLNTTTTVNNNTSTPAVTSPVTNGGNNINNFRIATNSASSNSTPLVSSVVKNYSNPGSNNTGTASTPVNSGSSVNQTLPGNYYSKTDSNSVASETNKPVITTPEHKDTIAITQQTLPVAPVKKDTSVITSNTTTDTLTPEAKRKIAAHPLHFSLSDFYASAFFSPELSADVIKDNDSRDNVTPNTIRTNEGDQFSFYGDGNTAFGIAQRLWQFRRQPVIKSKSNRRIGQIAWNV